MPDLTVTPAQVFPSPGASTQKLTAKVTIAAGDAIAKGTDGKAALADANDAALFTPIGLAVCSATNGQPVLYAGVDANFTIGTGANPVNGIPYFLSGNPGKLCTAADLAPGMHSCLVGFGKTGGKLVLNIVPSGITL